MLDFLFGQRKHSREATSTAGGFLVKQGSRKKDRVVQEVLMIAPRFTDVGGVHFDEENGDWLMIPRYPLPDKWEQRWCRLLILFPPGYPETPPIGFYLNQMFRLKNGGKDEHFTGQGYYGAPDLTKSGWYWYCVQIVEGAWRPQADHTKPDNLWTFLNMVRESLTSDY